MSSIKRQRQREARTRHKAQRDANSRELITLYTWDLQHKRSEVEREGLKPPPAEEVEKVRSAGYGTGLPEEFGVQLIGSMARAKSHARRAAREGDMRGRSVAVLTVRLPRSQVRRGAGDAWVSSEPVPPEAIVGWHPVGA